MNGRITPITPVHQSSGVLQRNTCACGKPINDVGGECDDCQKKREAAKSSIIQRSATNGFGIDGVPPSVHETLRSPGQRLDVHTRETMESRFGHDFSGVRVHADGQAARSARDVAAHAYTVGQDVAFGAGEYRPNTSDGQRLIAHELTHVVQQAGVMPGNPLRIEPVNSVAEAEAEQISQGIKRTPSRPRRYGLHRSPTKGCMTLLNRPSAGSFAALGNAVEAAIKADFTARVGPLTTGVQIENGSAGPQKTETFGKPNVIKPQEFVDDIASTMGVGKPDLAFKRGRTMEIAEVKPANWGPFGFLLGEGQLARYLLNGNEDYNADVRSQLGIGAFVPMTSRRYRPPPMMMVMGKQVNVMWCGPGMIVYKVKETDRKKRREKRKTQKKNQKTLKKQMKKTGKQLGKGGKGAAKGAARGSAKGGLSRAAGRALAYAELAAAVVLLATGRAEARFDGSGSSPLEALFESMTQNGAQLSPELKKMIAADKDLQQLLEQGAETGDLSESQQAINDRILKLISESPNEFTEEDLKVLLESMQASATAASASPETVEQLHEAIEAAKRGAPADGQQPPAGTKGTGGTSTTSGAQVGDGGTTVPKEGAQAGESGEIGDPEVQRPREVLSEETRKQIAGMPPEMRRFYDEWASGEGGGPIINDEAVKRFLKLVPQNLTEEEANQLIALLSPNEDKPLEELLAELESTVKALRAGRNQKPQKEAKPPAKAPPAKAAPEKSSKGEKGGTEAEGVTRDEYTKAVIRAIQDYKDWSKIASDEMRFVLNEPGRGFDMVRQNDESVNIVIFALQPTTAGGTRQIAAFAQCIVRARTSANVTIQLQTGAVFFDAQGQNAGTINKGKVFAQSPFVR